MAGFLLRILNGAEELGYKPKRDFSLRVAQAGGEVEFKLRLRRYWIKELPIGGNYILKFGTGIPVARGKVGGSFFS